MRIRAAITKVCILAVLVFYATAGAEIKIRSVDVSPYIGSYFFEKNMAIDLDHGMIMGMRLGYNITENWGIEATGGYMNTETKNPFMTPHGWLLEKDTNVDFFLFHIDALYHLTPMEQVTPYIAFGGGANNMDPSGFDSDIDPLFNYGLGVKYFFSEWIAFRVDCRHLIAIDELDNFEDPGKNLHNNLTFDAGLTLSLWGKGLDDDQDGVINKLDKCPNTPKGVKVDADGCPLDTDGDGVADYLDKCPDTPKGVKVDANGCPVDTDGDGVADYLDKCPNTPSGVKVDKNGCPLDTDGDGIPDYLDKCPNEPEDKDGFQDEDGCPDPDNDGDGILDINDKCPNEAETFNGFEDEDGCPDAVILKKDDVINIDNIYFQSGKADLVASSFPVLDSVKRIFIDNPGLTVRIEGHTDSQGAAAFNKNLSQKRAETVLNYLVKNLGIPKEQLTALGYGEERPVADNKTNEGRAKNRRIEFRVMK
jgi:OmpA-OmpF porin, OOP family